LFWGKRSGRPPTAPSSLSKGWRSCGTASPIVAVIIGFPALAFICLTSFEMFHSPLASSSSAGSAVASAKLVTLLDLTH